MKKKSNRLSLRQETVRVLSGRGLEIVQGGVISGPTNGDVECPTTAGFPGCEPQSQGCSQGCSNTCPSGGIPRCPPWPDPP